MRMACLKCGKETGETSVFCDECLQVMEQYPVNPGTPVILPKRTSHIPDKKASQKKKQTPEQQIARLQLSVRRLRIISLVLLLLAGLLFFLLLK